MNAELTTYTRADIEAMLMNMAKLRVIGPRMFVGEFHGQEVRWIADGGAEIVTRYTRGSLPPVVQGPLPRRGRQKQRSARG
jgi:hypothetical protein